jgi:dephospho-CoA kinase
MGIVADFGTDFVNPDGTLNRRRLGSIVFSNPERLAKLNALIHPPVHAREKALVDAYARDHPDGIAVTEAAILIETGSYKDYDRLIVAVCQPEQQIERSMARDQLTRQEVLDRLSRQMPLKEKAKYADFVIDTSGTKENTLQQTRAVYESLKKLNP